jgi:cytochrome c biogenesis protein CcdA/thiol-disulfide isomerase/thioredoxin
VLILLLVAFVAGVLTILSPCILPVVPLVLGTASSGGRARPLGIVAGLAISFTLFSVVLASTLAALGLTTSTLRGAAVLALAGCGLALLIPALGRRLEARLAPLARLGARATGGATRRGDFAGGLVLGAGLGLIWAPCAGPIMGAVLALAATGGASPVTAAVALAYAIGAGVPLLLIGYGSRALVARMRGAARRDGIQRAFGGLMLLACLAILFNLDLRAQDAVAGALPADWSTRLYSVEQQPAVAQELRTLQAPAPNIPAATVAPATPAPAQPVMQKESPAMAEQAQPPAVPAAPTATPAPAAKEAPAAALQAPGEGTLPAAVSLHNRGRAPEPVGITEWINSGPLTLQQLRGQVVLVHFWTFACINCIHVQPHVKAWYDRYHDAGFTVLGIHTPELSFEREIANVRDAVQQDGVRFPVAFDPKYATWSAYNNGYWPAFYYVDKQGQIRYTHIGEGDYAGQEQAIRQLLLEPAGGS